MGFWLWVIIAAILGVVLYTSCALMTREREDWYDREYGANRGEDED